jgi:hypothetical protein
MCELSLTLNGTTDVEHSWPNTLSIGTFKDDHFIKYMWRMIFFMKFWPKIIFIWFLLKIYSMHLMMCTSSKAYCSHYDFSLFIHRDLDSLPWTVHWRRASSILTVHFNKNKKQNWMSNTTKGWDWTLGRNVFERICPPIHSVSTRIVYL